MSSGPCFLPIQRTEGIYHLISSLKIAFCSSEITSSTALSILLLLSIKAFNSSFMNSGEFIGTSMVRTANVFKPSKRQIYCIFCSKWRKYQTWLPFSAFTSIRTTALQARTFSLVSTETGAVDAHRTMFGTDIFVNSIKWALVPQLFASRQRVRFWASNPPHTIAFFWLFNVSWPNLRSKRLSSSTSKIVATCEIWDSQLHVSSWRRLFSMWVTLSDKSKIEYSWTESISMSRYYCSYKSRNEGSAVSFYDLWRCRVLAPSRELVKTSCFRR